MEKSLLLEAYLKQLRPPAVGRHYQEVARQAVQGNFSYEVFLLALMELEAQQREENAHQKRLRLARFPVVKTLDQFDFTALPTLNKAQLFFQVVAQSYERQSLIITTKPGVFPVAAGVRQRTTNRSPAGPAGPSCPYPGHEWGKLPVPGEPKKREVRVMLMIHNKLTPAPLNRTPLHNSSLRFPVSGAFFS